MKPKRKSTWMRGFVIGPAKTPAELLRIDSAIRQQDYRNKQLKRGRH